MAFKQYTIKLANQEIPVLPAPAFSACKALPGKVVVQLAPPRTQMSGFELPITVGQKYWANVGTVLSAGGSRSYLDEWCAPDLFLEPGDHVLLRPYDGMWIDGFSAGGYRAESRVVFYGGAGSPSLYDVTNGQMGDKDDNGEFEPVPWWESVVAKIGEGHIAPTGDNVLVRRKKKEFAIEVPDDLGFWQDEVEVLACGPFTDVREGPAVVRYTHLDLLDFDFADMEGLAIIPADCIHAYINA